MRRLLVACLELLPLVAQGAPPAIPPSAPYTPAYVSVTNRAPTQLDDGTSGTPCAANMLWGYGGKYWQNQGCSAGHAHWVQIGNPGLPLDAVVAAGGPMGHCWAFFQCTSSFTGTVAVLSNVAASPTTYNLGLNGTLANYAGADNFLANYPMALSAIPDSISGAIDPLEVTVTQINDQTTLTAYNSASSTGVYTATASGGTGYSGTVVVTLTTTGCTNVVSAPTIAVSIAGGAPKSVSLSAGSSQIVNPGVCLAGAFQASQTEASHTGTEGTAATWTVTTYNEGPIWDQYNQMGPVFRGAKFNSVPSQLGSNQLNIDKVIEIPGLVWTPSASTLIAVMQFDLNRMSQPIISGPGATAPIILAANHTNGGVAKIVVTGNAADCALMTEADPAVFGFIWNYSGSPKFYCQSGNTMATNTINGSAQSADTGLEIGESSGSGTGTNPPYLKGRLVGLLFWPSVLTQAQFQAAVISLTELGALQPQYDTIIYVEGDSNHTSGSITEDTVWSFVPNVLNRPAKIRNAAIHGALCTSEISNGDFAAGLTYGYESGVRQFIYANDLGMNDLRGSTTVPQLEACVQTFINDAHALGSNVSYVDLLPVAQCDVVQTGSLLTNAEAWYSWVVHSTYVTQANGGPGLTPGLDTFINGWNDPLMSNSTYVDNGTSVSTTASPYCSQPASATTSWPNLWSPEGEHQTRDNTIQWIPFYGAALNSILH